MVYGATLEMLCTETYRRFKSCPLRQNPKIPHKMRDFCVLAERTEMKRFLVVRVSALPTYAEAHTLAWETALSCPILSKYTYPHSMRDFLCFSGEDRAEGVPCGSRVGSADIRRGSHACAGNGVILSDSNEKALPYLSAPHFMRDFFVFWRRGQS